MLIDTHCHFNTPKLSGDLEACLERAGQSGVGDMIVVGFDKPSSALAVELAGQDHSPYGVQLWAVVGVHPHDAKEWRGQEDVDQLKRWADHPRVVAIGEIGLDFHYDFSPRDTQETVFRTQLQLAQEVGLPIVIHCREAYLETLQILMEEDGGANGGVMHCWAGSVAEAERTVELGLMLGFGGTLTFKNADETREAARRTPLESLLIETDAPYLAPVPFRGKRNEPSYVRYVAQTLADLRGMTLEELGELTTANARRCFPKLVGEG